MAALRRGIAHYQGGTPDVQYPASGLRPDLSNAVNIGQGMLAAPGDPRATIAAREQMYQQQGIQPQITPEYMQNLHGQAYANEMQAKGFTPVIRNQPGQQGGNPAFEGGVPLQAPAARGFGQLLTGQFTAAQQNPESSPATAALGQFAEYLSNARRVNVLGQKPSGVEKIAHFFGGSQGDPSIAQHEAAADTFRDAQMQQYLMHNPDQLAKAENDRLAYAQNAQTNPEFQKQMQASLGALAEAQNDPKIHPANHNEVTNIMQKTGANAAQANASIAPHAYTKEEFRKVMLGAPLQVVQALFPELSHYVTPDEALTKTYFDKLHGDYATALDELQKMGAEDQDLIKQQKNPVNSQTSWFGWGKSKIDQKQDQVNKLRQYLMDQMAVKAGTYQKPYQIPAKID